MSVDAAVKRIQSNLNQHFFDWDVTRDELQDNNQAIHELSPGERNEAIARLSDDQLQHWARETTGWNSPLSADERQALLNTLAQSLDGAQAARVARAFGAEDMAQAIATHGSAAQKRDFIAAIQGQADGSASQIHAGLGVSTTTRGNAEARAAAQVLASMDGGAPEMSQAIRGLEQAGKLDDVLAVASGRQDVTYQSSSPYAIPAMHTSFREEPLTRILQGVAQLPQGDPARAQAFKAAMGTLQDMQTATGGGRQDANAQSVQNVADGMGRIFSRQEAIDQGLWTPPPNPDPSRISMDGNIAAAHAHSGDLLWFYDQVKSGGPMDYKAGNDDQGKAEDYENFGNFNFGVVAAAHGIPEEVAKGGAGAYQVYSGTSDIRWLSSYFDDPRDTAQIAAGYDYYQSGMWRVWPDD